MMRGTRSSAITPELFRQGDEMKKLWILTMTLALTLGTSLAFAQAGGGSTGTTKPGTTKPGTTSGTTDTTTTSGKKHHKGHHKGGKKSKKSSGGTTTPPPK